MFVEIVDHFYPENAFIVQFCS